MSLPTTLHGCLRLPLIGAPMFIVSVPRLVIEQCKAGIIGAFPALNARPQEALDSWIRQIKDELSAFAQENPGEPVAPFAVNQIVHQSNTRVYADMETCVKHEVPIIITSLRPPGDVVRAVHGYGGLVFHDVISLRHARKAIEHGVDGIVAVCAGAGGHAGALSPFALVKEIRREFDGAIILSGSMSGGSDILAAQAIGADLAYIGTRFIATEEANALPDYKTMIVDCAASDIVYSSLFSGVLGNYLKPSVAKAGYDPDNLPDGSKDSMNFAKRAEIEAKAWRDIWSAGQGVGSIDDVPRVRDLVLRMQRQYEETRERLGIG